jgi:serine/threonine-protein kinase
VPNGRERTARNTGPLALGECVDGKYRITELLAMGGMGVVYGAWHSKLDCPVALKVIRPELCTDPEFLRRFSEEARSAALLRGEHVAEVLDFGCSDRGLPYLVFERLEGSDLRTILTQAGRLPTSRALQYVAQACEALNEAHALGVVHRDVKPENLFVARRADGRLCLKVLDFGIAKRACAGFTTQAGRGLGSPYYMSPEQLTETTQVDRRTDIWSLGVVLFELVTGECPFTGGTPTEIGARVLSAPVPSIVSRGIPAPDVDALIARCLERDPAKRFATAEELGLALRAALRSRQEFESSPQHQGGATPAGVLLRDSGAPSRGSRAFGVATLVAAVAAAVGVLASHGIPNGPSVGASQDLQLRGVDRRRSPASWVELRAPAELERELPTQPQQRSGRDDGRRRTVTDASAANASSWRGELAPLPLRRSSPDGEMSDGRARGAASAKSSSRAARSNGKPWRANGEDAVDASSLERALGRWLDAVHADAPDGR